MKQTYLPALLVAALAVSCGTSRTSQTGARTSTSANAASGEAVVTSSVPIGTASGSTAPITSSTTESPVVTARDNNTGATRETAAPGVPNLDPKGSDPAWAGSIDDNMLVVIEKLQSYNAPPLHTLTAQQARMQPSPATAAKDVMMENNVMMPPPAVDTMGTMIPVDGGQIHARIYKPKMATGALPVITYYHGGGWVIADLDTYDASAKALAEKTNAIVVSVHYRQAPEHKFPTAHNDAFAAYQWTLRNAASLGGDPMRVAVAGESAGGNLACNVSIMARDRGVQMPVHQLLVYPIASGNTSSGSYMKYADAKPLSKPLMEWFFMNYLTNMSEANDPRINLVAADLKGLPATTLITAQIDPLHDEGRMLADRLKAAGVSVRDENYEGVTHEFFGMALLLDEAAKAQTLSTRRLSEALMSK